LKKKIDDDVFGFESKGMNSPIPEDNDAASYTGDPVRNLKMALINNPITRPRVEIFGNVPWDESEDEANFGAFNLTRSLAGMMRGSYLLGSIEVVVTTESVAKITQDFGRIIYDFRYY